jgi:hypothetical protein
MEWELGAIDGLGLDDVSMLRAAVSLNGFVGGIALSRAMEVEIEQNSGIASKQRQAADQDLADELFSGGKYPIISRLKITDEEAADVDALFEFGLQRHLDGLAALLGKL